MLLRAHTGNDFSCYKNNTIGRRIERRMSVHQFDSLPQYVRFLQENPQEVELLYKELLIGVTNFFRDPGLFEFLKEKAVPGLLADRPKDRPLRLWNPGCSTGEETYSLAMMLRECLEARRNEYRPTIQIFATDIDHDAIEKARQGTFSAGIAADVSPERLARFFVPEGDGYRIKKEVRDLVVFAPQNMLVDPPFTRLDILCCRNLLIYLNVQTQKKLLPLMHYALDPGGLLILGTAESVGGTGHLFAPLDSKWKVFERRQAGERSLLEMPAHALRHERGAAPSWRKPRNRSWTFSMRPSGRCWIGTALPPWWSTAEGDIIYVNGRTGKYLEPSSGKVNMNVFAMAREGLREELDAALHDAAKHKTAVTRSGLRIRSNGGFSTVNLTVRPLGQTAGLRGMFLVVFEEVASDPPTVAESPPGPAAGGPAGRSRGRAPPHPRTPADHRRGNAGRPGGAPLRQRGVAVQQRGIAEHQRGNDQFQGGIAIAQ